MYILYLVFNALYYVLSNTSAFFQVLNIVYSALYYGNTTALYHVGVHSLYATLYCTNTSALIQMLKYCVLSPILRYYYCSVLLLKIVYSALY